MACWRWLAGIGFSGLAQKQLAFPVNKGSPLPNVACVGDPVGDPQIRSAPGFRPVTWNGDYVNRLFTLTLLFTAITLINLFVSTVITPFTLTTLVTPFTLLGLARCLGCLGFRILALTSCLGCFLC